MGWTNNWTAMKNALLCGVYHADLSSMYNISGTLVETTAAANGGVSVPSPMLPFNQSIACTSTGSSTGYAYLQVAFGSGDTAPSAADYALASPLSNISAISTVHESLSIDAVNKTVTRVEKITVQNTNASSVTIREWGIILYGYTNYLSGGRFLIYRALLDNAVTLGANQAATLELTMSVTLDDPV
ncbi:MAG: hypothetical protein J6S60_07305 [Oscillospiraceae bacterium]|nr:hypothetical protein [Oscillospiraceae bacterium]